VEVQHLFQSKQNDTSLSVVAIMPSSIKQEKTPNVQHPQEKPKKINVKIISQIIPDVAKSLIYTKPVLNYFIISAI
jgi:hypothetical protein